MSERARTVADIIDQLGGSQAVADLMGTSRITVAVWRHRGSFPGWALLRLHRIAEARAIRYDPRLFERDVPRRGAG